ncbi:ATP-binding protein [Capnocytophaga canis]|uniref:ATP-binding protein n=1 Tax=Capnocytophaga canis TaxID=1848903 RepID=UPI00370D4348
MESLFQYSNHLITNTDIRFVRYLYSRINWENRLIGIVGARGVGKTTLILQYIKNELDTNKTLYVTAEDFYFGSNKLVDLADVFVKFGGKHLFIDEIHKYPQWAKELKLIYDYYPDLKIVFTGSSVLDIKKGSADLSRRAVLYTMQGLSFREYLNLFHQIELPQYTLEQILAHQVTFPKDIRPLPLFVQYLKNGYYPFAREEDFGVKLHQVINQTLEVDIPLYADMNVSTGRKLKHLLMIVAQSVPFKPNMSKIAEMIGVSRNNVADYLLFLEEAGLITQLRTPTQGIRALGKVDKIYLENTNLNYNLAKESQEIGNVRETFFFNQLKLNHRLTNSSSVDFTIDETTNFEIGGKNKGSKQLQNLQNSFLVKDDIEHGFLNTIPLWNFGLMY